MSTCALSVDVPAKVNLHLRVVGRRPDGFHELRTLFASVGLWDRLTALPAPEGQLILDVRPEGVVDAGPENLVLKAARRLWRECGRTPGARIQLDKSIPVGGGMGGGSADAAGALVLLDRLWGFDLEPSTLHRLAADLGSDVPFFLYGGFALGVGRGEEILPLEDLEAPGFVLVIPEAGVSTAEVFSKIRVEGWAGLDPEILTAVTGPKPVIPWERVVNDLEGVVLRDRPEIAEALDAIRGLEPLRAAVSGSGATVFGVFPSVGAARTAARRLHGPWRVEAVEYVERFRARPRVVPVDSRIQEES